MFKNEKKGRLYGINKTTTYVDNPPIENTTTKITRSINFSKGNFINLGKWILIIVLFLYFGSYTINGFVASNITKNSTEETIVHEYKKVIGYESSGGKLNNITSLNDIVFNYNNKKILYNFDNFIMSSKLITNISSVRDNTFLFNCDSFEIFDINNNLVYTDTSGQMRIVYGTNSSWGSYFTSSCKIFLSKTGDFKWSSGYPSLFFYSSQGSYNIYYNNGYFKFNNLSSISFAGTSYNLELLVENFNSIFTFESFLTPVYEITRYEYPVKDINYDWNYKLLQISKFRPLFNSKDLFIDEEFYKYSNLITYQLRNNETEIQNTINKYKSDERLTILFDNDAITLKMREYNYHLNNNKKDYISYIYFNFENIDFTDNQVYNAYNYALENYVSATNIDDYVIYSKMNFDAKDVLILMSFPIQIVMNTLYNFGVLVGIVTLW